MDFGILGKSDLMLLTNFNGVTTLCDKLYNGPFNANIFHSKNLIVENFQTQSVIFVCGGVK